MTCGIVNEKAWSCVCLAQRRQNEDRTRISDLWLPNEACHCASFVGMAVKAKSTRLCCMDVCVKCDREATSIGWICNLGII